MGNKVNVFVVMWVMLTLVACSQKLQVTSQHNTTDSVSVTETMVNIPVVIPAETLYVEVPVPAPCDSVIGQMFTVQESPRVKFSIKAKKKLTPEEPTMLIVDISCKGLTDTVAVQKQVINRLRTEITNNEKETVRNACAKCVRWYHQAALWACAAFALIYIGRFAWKTWISKWF